MKVSARLEEGTGAWRVEKDGWVGWHAHPTRQEMEGGKTALSEEEMQAREEEAEPECKPKAEAEKAEQIEEEEVEEAEDDESPSSLRDVRGGKQKPAGHGAQKEQVRRADHLALRCLLTVLALCRTSFAHMRTAFPASYP